MGETVLALDSAAATSRGSGSDFTIKLHPALLLDKSVDYKLASIFSDIYIYGIRVTKLLETTICSGTMTVQSGSELRYHRVLTIPRT